MIEARVGGGVVAAGGGLPTGVAQAETAVARGLAGLELLDDEFGGDRGDVDVGRNLLVALGDGQLDAGLVTHEAAADTRDDRATTERGGCSNQDDPAHTWVKHAYRGVDARLPLY